MHDKHDNTYTCADRPFAVEQTHIIHTYTTRWFQKLQLFYIVTQYESLLNVCPFRWNIYIFEGILQSKYESICTHLCAVTTSSQSQTHSQRRFDTKTHTWRVFFVCCVCHIYIVTQVRPRSAQLHSHPHSGYLLFTRIVIGIVKIKSMAIVGFEWSRFVWCLVLRVALLDNSIIHVHDAATKMC